MHEQRTAADIDLAKLRRIGCYGETCMSEATGQAWGWEPHANLCRRAQRQSMSWDTANSHCSGSPITRTIEGLEPPATRALACSNENRTSSV